MAQSGTGIAAVRTTRKGATIHKTNERPGTRAQARHVRVSAYKAREVLDLIRGKHVDEAADILRFTEREVATVIGKVLTSAVANATNNDGATAHAADPAANVAIPPVSTARRPNRSPARPAGTTRAVVATR